MPTTLAPSRKHAFILSHPRTASNLFMKIFKSHPDVVPAEYPFLKSFYYSIESQCNRKNPKTDAYLVKFREEPGVPQTFEDSFTKLKEDILKADELVSFPPSARIIWVVSECGSGAIVDSSWQGKVAFVKEHIYTFLKPSVIDSNLETPRPPVPTRQVRLEEAEMGISTNPTLLPDDFMLSLSPVFLIRHPALVFSSWYKISHSSQDADVDDIDFPIEVSFRWSRILYDWYLTVYSESPSCSDQNQRRKPTVIDADDTMSDRSALERLCHKLQLDPDLLSFKWQVTTTGLTPWMDSIQKSTAVNTDKLSKGLDIQREFAKWEEGFGSHVAQKLLRFVELAMPDYEYLLARRA